MELVVAIALMAIAFAGVSTTLASTMSMRKSNQETARAIRAALSLSEALRDEDITQVFARYNADEADDPDGVGTAPGPNFAVAGLTAQAGDPDGLVGWISFPGDGMSLREDVEVREQGMPRDLNGDGLIDGLDHASDYLVLPVTITIQWAGPRGPSSIQITATMTAQ